MKFFNGLLLALFASYGLVATHSLANDQDLLGVDEELVSYDVNRDHHPYPNNSVRYSVNQTQGPYAPSCNGNPVFPSPDYRCCQFGSQALCFTYSVGCNYGERLVRADVYCSGYTNSSYALEVGRMGNQAVQLACQKIDGRKGYVTLSGNVLCARRRH